MMMRKTPLKQRTPLKRTTPLKQTAFPNRSGFLRTGSRRKKKIEGHHDNKMLAACRDEPCFLAVPGVCLGEAGRETVVPCHSNDGAHGKAMGLKAADRYSVPGCMTCHQFLDQGPAEKQVKREIFNSALERWEPVRAQKLKERK